MRDLRDLSLDEKAALSGGADVWHTVAIDRLGIPALRMTDGPSGARGDRYTGGTSTCVPCGSALASTWNRDLVRRIGSLLGDEARAKGAGLLLAPTVNIHRHPLAGRNFECFSEDPYLTAELAVAYVSGVQSRGVGCAIKHFVANDQEHERMSISAEVDERVLREIYLAPFEAAVRRAGVWAVMAAYNRVDGTHCSQHAGLLTDILRGDWGFDGLVVSDWFGTHDVAAIAAGLDVEMPGPPRHLGSGVAYAVRDGSVPEAAVDRAAAAVLQLLSRATDVDPASLPAGERPDTLARLAAQEAIVLLHNEWALPLDEGRLGSIAVLGSKASRPDFQGGGSAHVDPPYGITPLEGITARAAQHGADIRVTYEPGVPARPPEFLGPLDLRVPDGDSPGARLDYRAGDAVDGTPVHTEVVPRTRLFWVGPPAPGLPARGPIVVTATADFTPDRSGLWMFALSSVGGSRVLLDGELLVDNMVPERGSSFFGRGSTEVAGAAELVAGRAYRLEAQLFGELRDGTSVNGLGLTAEPPRDEEALERAVSAAADADVAVVVVGTATVDTEGADRAHMDLPDDQVALVRAVADMNPSTIVLLNTGSPVTMDWYDDVAAVAQVWYGGQEMGTAIAEVLFGDVDACGRLPTTFPERLEDTPAFPTYPGADGRASYSEGHLVGYRHYDTNGVEPLFCFGHGLSYTHFAYGEAVAVSGRAVQVEVTNVGERAGREVVQLYVRAVAGAVQRPEQELKDFVALDLAPGESQVVEFELTDAAVAVWDVAARAWSVEPGDYELRIGSSSRDIHATAVVSL